MKMAYAGLALVLVASSGFAGGGDIRVDDAWIRAAPPTAMMLAAYMKVENTSDRPRTLTGAESSFFAQVEMHNTLIKDGMAQMVHQEKVEIPARGSVEFSPGGYHFMLMAPNEPLRIGDKVDFTLSFGNGEQVVTEAEVRKATPMAH